MFANAVFNPISVMSSLGSSLPKFSIYFANFILMRALVGIPTELLNTWPLLSFFANEYFSWLFVETKRNRIKRQTYCYPMLYGWRYPNILMVSHFLSYNDFFCLPHFCISRR